MSTFFTVFFILLTVIGLGVIFIIYAFQEGWFNQIQTVQNLTRATHMVIRIIDNVSSMTKSKTQNYCTINNTKQSAGITYFRLGEERLLTFPYNRQVKERMRPWKVFLVREKNTTINITQECGFPYLCTPEQLGGKEILAKNGMTEEIIQYEKGTIPGYLGLSDLQINSPKIAEQ